MALGICVNPRDEGGEYRHCGRRQSWNTEGLTQGVWANLLEALNRLFRQTRHPMKGEPPWDPASFVALQPLDLTLLPAKVAFIFHRGLERGCVNAAESIPQLEANAALA
jgi:hypothetical protein